MNASMGRYQATPRTPDTSVGLFDVRWTFPPAVGHPPSPPTPSDLKSKVPGRTGKDLGEKVRVNEPQCTETGDSGGQGCEIKTRAANAVLQARASADP